MIPLDLLELLRCPHTGQPLARAETGMLASLNQRIAQTPGSVCNQGGAVIDKPLAEALLRSDRAVLYPVRDGIPLLLAEEGILL